MKKEVFDEIVQAIYDNTLIKRGPPGEDELSLSLEYEVKNRIERILKNQR